MSDRPLPADVKRDLDRAAAGVGRVATTAHPDCICGKPTGKTSSWPGGRPYPVLGQREDCPQHRPEKGQKA